MFPYDTASYEGVTEVISTGYGSGLQGTFTVVAIVVCIVALVVGQAAEAKKYKNYK